MQSKPFIKKKSHIGWYLFDFTNSIAVVIGGIYFSKWFIQDVGAGSIIFNILFLISAIVILFSGKLIGKFIDQQGYKKWITFSSILSGIALFLLFIFSQILQIDLIVYFTFPTFLIFLISYQISRICHNVYYKSYIPLHLQSKVSGYGTTANWAGSLFGILITLPILSYYPTKSAREITFLLAAIVFSILTPLALKLMFSGKEILDLKPKNKSLSIKEGEVWKSVFPKFSIVLLSYFLLFDVMSTVQRNLPSFLTSVHNLSDNIQSYAFLIILFSAMLGGVYASKKIQEINSSKWLKIGSLLLGISIILINIPNQLILWIAFGMAGFCYGVLESTIRIDFSKSFEPNKAGENFGLLASVERASGVVGPLFWIIPFSIFSNNIFSYKISMLFLAMIVFIAYILINGKKN